MKQETLIKHPYTQKIVDKENDEDMSSVGYPGFKSIQCPDCKKEILHEPTAKELREMTRYVYFFTFPLNKNC